MHIRSPEYRDIVRQAAFRIADSIRPGSVKVDRWKNVVMETRTYKQRFKVKDRVLRIELKNASGEWVCQASVALGQAVEHLEAWQARVFNARRVVAESRAAKEVTA